ncbi:MAG: hypothetical protein WBJ81_07205 [Rickettsiales bacterium]
MLITLNACNKKEMAETLAAIESNDPKYSNIKFTNLDQESVQNLANALKKNKYVVKLDLQGNDIDDNGAKALAEALIAHQSITILDLKNNKIRDMGAKAIARFVELNNTITNLEISNNNISVDGTQALTQASKVNKQLNLDINANITLIYRNEDDDFVINKDTEEQLDLDKVIAAIANNSPNYINVTFEEIDDESVQNLAQALINNKILTVLRFSEPEGNGDGRPANIGDEGAKAIAEALKVNRSINTLDLKRNNITDKAVIDLLKALEINGSITSLDLHNNNISDRGAKAIAQALKVHKSITHLNLGSNKISDEGAKAIAETLKVNKSINSLNLSYNNISDTGYSAIVQSLEQNKYVLDFDDTFIKEISKDNRNLIRKHLNRNKKFLETALEIVLYADIKNLENLISKEEKQAIINILGNRSLEEELHSLKDLNLPVISKKFKSYVLNTALDHSKAFNGLFPELRDSVNEITYPKNGDLKLNPINDLINLIPKTELNSVTSYFRDSKMNTTPEEIDGIDKMLKASGNLKKLLDIPNNIIFLKDALENGRTFADFTANLNKINADEKALEFIRQDPKKLGYLVSSKPEELQNRILILSNNFINNLSTNQGSITDKGENIEAGEKRKRTDSFDSNQSTKFQNMGMRKESSRRTP